jgi:2-C-methyl-D-erythritol 2,4-cyclodiphosphate synthase
LKDVRVGLGYDCHRLVEGRKLVIGGVVIPHGRGLEGHSDADVLLHALVDALLGALAAGDIGGWFPDDDPRHKDTAGSLFVERAMEEVRRRGYRVGNVDAVVVAEEPKIAAHVPAMKKTIAALLGVTEEDVSIKGKTNEKMGSLGRAEGIAAHVVVLLSK